MRSGLVVLAVCTGNICRSPAVERLLAAGLDVTFRGGPSTPGASPAIEVASAGTAALVGAAMEGSMARLVASAGGDPRHFVARQLTPAILHDADLVLTLTRRHRAAVVELTPAAARRTFTLRELARLAAVVDPSTLPGASATVADRLRALVPLAAGARGTAAPGRSDDDDVIDPYRGGDALYAKSFAQLLPAVRAIVETVRG